MNKLHTKFLISILSYGLLSNLPSSSFAQMSSQITYGGSGDEAIFEIRKTPDGYAMGGFTNSFGAGNFDFYLVKTNEIGILEWSKTFGGSGSDECYGMKQTLDGGYIMTGYSNSFGFGSFDAFIVKTDISGSLLWSRTIGGFNNDFTITLAGDGGYLLVGTTNSFGSGSTDIYLCKIDTSGNLQWSKALGGSSFEWGFHANQTSDGGYIVTGITFTFGSGNYDFYVAKIDANGNLQWTKTYGGANRDDGRHAEQTLDGGYIIAGYTQSFGAGATDVLLIKTDVNGNLQWKKTFGGSGNDYGESVKQTVDGGYIINGSTESFGFGNSDAYIIKTDSIGNVEWSRTYGGSGIEYSNKLDLTPDGGYVLASRTQSFGAGGYDFYFIKTDFNGITGCNENLTPATISNTPVVQISSGGSLTIASPSVTTPSPVEANPSTISSVLCQNIPAGLFCANAIQLTSANPCKIQDTLIAKEKWFYFIPDSSDVEIVATNLTPNAGHVHDMILFAGMCNVGLYPIASSTLEPLDTSIRIKAKDLMIGVPHFIQLLRTQADPGCSVGFANYNICIQNLPAPTITTDTNGIVFIDGVPSHIKNEVIIRFNKLHLKMTQVDDTSKKEMPIPVFIQPQMIQKMANQIFNGNVIGLGQLKLKKVFPKMLSIDSISISRLGDTIRIPDFWSTFILTIPDTMSVIKTGRALSRVNGIQYSEPNYVSVTNSVPNDFLYSLYQGSLTSLPAYPNADINMEGAWDIETGNPFVKVGVYDTGIDQTHSELSGGKVGGGFNFYAQTALSSPYDNDGHGTSCAGIIGAYRNNTTGIAGIAGGDAAISNSGSTLYDMRIANGSFADDASVANAIITGATSTNAGGFGLHIMSNSWGGGVFSTQINNAVKFAVQNGVIFLASRGNYPNTQGIPVDGYNYPACFQDEMVINVGASGTDGQWKTNGNGNPLDPGDDQYQSMYTKNVDIIAPGTNAVVYTTEANTNNWHGFDGTSAACPHVSGVAALMLSHVDQSFPHISNLCIEDVENILQVSAIDKNATGYDDYAGWGLMDATAALNKIKKPAFKIQHFGLGQNVTSVFSAYNLHAKDAKIVLTRNFQGFPAGTYFADRYEVTLTYNYNLSSPTDQIISYWPRFSSTTGWSGANPNNTENWCYIVSVSSTQAILKTFVYNFKYGSDGKPVTDPWFPAQFAKAAFSIYTYDPLAVGLNEANNNLSSILSDPFPNPSKNKAIINLQLAREQEISFQLFDLHGKLIKTIANGRQSQGKYKHEIILSDLSPGIYFFQLLTENESFQKKMVVIK